MDFGIRRGLEPIPCGYTGRTAFTFVSVLVYKADSHRIFEAGFGVKSNGFDIL